MKAGREWNGPCPVCGGDDRFHVSEKDGRALVGCRQCLDGLPTDLRRKQFGKMMQAAFPDRVRRNGAARERAQPSGWAIETDEESYELRYPGTKENPFPGKDPETLGAVLHKLEIDVRFNLRTRRTEWRTTGVHFNDWHPVQDRKLAELRFDVKRQFYHRKADGTAQALYWGRDAFDDVLNALLSRREVDPLIERLEDLPKWDGTARVEGMLCNTLGAPWSLLAEWASLAIPLGVIQRAYEPGCKFDEIPVLIGPQGIGKSALLREFFWPDVQELYGDGLQWDAPAKVQVESLLGRAIVEVSEMVGRGRSEIENIKSLVTRQDDGAVRMPYARSPEPLPRRCIIVGTTNNETDLPNDPSGNRRFVPIVLTKGCNVEGTMKRYRDQLWAEALAMYAAGRRANLPRDLHVAQRKAAEVHRDRDDLIEDAIEALPDDGPYRLARIIEMMGESAKGVAQSRVVKALKNAGWQSRRTMSERLWERTRHDT